MQDKKFTSVSVPVEVKKKLDDMATKNIRSTSQHLVYLILEEEKRINQQKSQTA